MLSEGYWQWTFTSNMLGGAATTMTWLVAKWLLLCKQLNHAVQHAAPSHTHTHAQLSLVACVALFVAYFFGLLAKYFIHFIFSFFR